MLHKGAKTKYLAIVVGWVVAFACLIAVGLYIHRVSTRELTVMLCLDGEPLCSVEDQSVMEKALLLLEEKRQSSGLRDDAALNLSYRYVLSDGKTAVDAEICMELLYQHSFSGYSRAYMIAVQGMEIAACATYGEAEKVVEDFRAYIVKQVLASKADVDLVELTTEFEIRSVFFRSDRIASGEDIYRVMVGSAGRYNPNIDDLLNDTRVNALGSQSILYADKNTDFI